MSSEKSRRAVLISPFPNLSYPGMIEALVYSLKDAAEGAVYKLKSLYST